MHASRPFIPTRLRALGLPLLVLLGFLGCDIPYSEPTTLAGYFERAVSAYQEGDLDPARTYFMQAENMSRSEDRVELLLQALVYQTRISYELGDVQTAIEKAMDAAEIARQIGDFRAEAEVRIIEGLSYRTAGLLREADRALEDAVRISATFQEQPKVIEAHIALGDLWLSSPDPGPAAEHFSVALTTAQDISNDRLVARALYGLATVFVRQDKVQEAKNSIAQASQLLDGLDDPELLALVRLKQGEILQNEGNANAALSVYRDAVNGLRRARTGRRLEILCLFRIGLLYQEHQRKKDAKKYFSDGLEIARREGDKIAQYYLNVHLLLADIRLMTPVERSRIASRIVQAFAQLAEQFRGIMQHPGESQVSGIAGEVLREAGASGAIDYLARAARAEHVPQVAYLDPIMHASYIAALHDHPDEGRWSRAYASVLLQSERVVTALTALDLWRYNDFASQLGTASITLRHPVVARDAENIRSDGIALKLRGMELAAQLGSSRGTDTLARSVSEFKEGESSLARRSTAVIAEYPNYAVIVPADSLGLADIRRHIPRGITMIEHIGDGSQIHILAVSRTNMLIRTVAVAESTVHALSEEYTKLMLDPMVYSGEGGESSVPGMTRFAMLSTRLYDILLRPVESMIERGIIVIPTAMIGPLPVHALERQVSGGRLEYLIERMSVDYLPTWGSVMFPTRGSGRLRTIVAFGNPSGKNWSVDYELRDIRSFFRNADVYTGRDATWDNMRRTNPDLLQISSEFIPGLSSYGTFLVSTGEVTASTDEVAFERLLDFEAPPVVLLTNQAGGSYGLGPQHAVLLRMNGTSDVFLNRWIADRKAAKFFSEYFFTHLSGGLAPGDAYRQALLNLIQMRENAHPRSWAQFFHFGTG